MTKINPKIKSNIISGIRSDFRSNLEAKLNLSKGSVKFKNPLNFNRRSKLVVNSKSFFNKERWMRKEIQSKFKVNKN